MDKKYMKKYSTSLVIRDSKPKMRYLLEGLLSRTNKHTHTKANVKENMEKREPCRPMEGM